MLSPEPLVSDGFETSDKAYYEMLKSFEQATNQNTMSDLCEDASLVSAVSTTLKITL